MTVLAAHDLYRFYHVDEDETLALKGVSLHLDAGEIVAVVGPSGSGKSTLLACLAGLDEPDGGYVTILGERLTRRPENVRAAMRGAHIGTLLQSGNLFAHLSVEENVRLQQDVAGKKDRRYVGELLERVGIAHRRGARPAQLSGGEAARAGLAVALAARPVVLLADEPTAEVDAETEARLLALFAERRAGGEATLVVTHSEALAERADRRVTISDGRVDAR
jgi:putative ABC transport system ATP-binding protein